MTENTTESAESAAHRFAGELIALQERHDRAMRLLAKLRTFLTLLDGSEKLDPMNHDLLRSYVTQIKTEIDGAARSA